MYKVIELIEFVESLEAQSLESFLNQILTKLRAITGADAGTIYILSKARTKTVLKPISIQNDKIKIRSEKYSVPIDSEAIVSYVATHNKSLLIDDVYDLPPNTPYKFNSSFDKMSGYHSKSMMCFPLNRYEGDVLGVVQLINRKTKSKFEQAQLKLISPANHIISRAIERMDAQVKIEQKNKSLEQKNRTLQRKRREILQKQKETEDAFKISINLLAKAAEIHDEVTGNHIIRVNEYSYVLAKHHGMPQAFCDEIRYSAQLHDVGKMSVNTAVLMKKGKLTPKERLEMDRHPFYGYQILKQSDRLKMAAEIAYCHHEKWDGTGYPRGLKGDKIPIEARIVQLADIYDALRSVRPYKGGYTHQETCKIIISGDKRIDPIAHFDPNLLTTFAKCHKEFDRVWKNFMDR